MFYIVCIPTIIYSVSLVIIILYYCYYCITVLLLLLILIIVIPTHYQVIEAKVLKISRCRSKDFISLIDIRVTFHPDNMGVEGVLGVEGEGDDPNELNYGYNMSYNRACSAGHSGVGDVNDVAVVQCEIESDEIDDNGDDNNN